MEYKVNYKGYEFNITQNEDGSFNIPSEIKDIEQLGTAMKPANEPICVARKPLSEKSVAENVLKWGTGGINIDGCRVGTTDTYNYKNGPGGNSFSVGEKPDGKRTEPVEMNSEGRFPANIILECICDEVIKGEKRKSRKGGLNESDFSKAISPNPDYETEHYNDKGDIHTNPLCPCYLLDEQSGVLKSGNISPHKQKTKTWKFSCDNVTSSFIGDTGGASRFFYQAKVSKAERNMGLELSTKNTHPTLKPVNLMAYLCRLVTPSNGVVLDPFMGSGSTGISAQLEGFNFIGMEMDEDYFNIAESRINNYEEYRKFIK